MSTLAATRSIDLSNLWFNIRFGTYHFQSGPSRWFRWSYNECHTPERREPGWKWFAVYCAFGKFFN